MLKLEWDNEARGGDVVFEGGRLVEDDGLQAAVLLSLFIDARAQEGDLVGSGQDRRGYWADVFDDEHPGETWGSRLWTLRRNPITDQTRLQAVEMAREGLGWMEDEGLVEEVIATSVRLDTGAVLLAIDIRKPGEAQPERVFTGAVTGAV